MQQPGSALRRAQQHEKRGIYRDRPGWHAADVRKGREADEPLRETSSLDMVGADEGTAPGAAIANALAIQSRMHDSRRHFTQGLNTCVAGSETRGKSTDSHPQSQNTGFYKNGIRAQ